MTDAATDYLLSKCSVAVYDDEQGLRERNARDLQLSDLRFFDAGTVQAFVAQRGDVENPVVVVCFRGTESDDLADWLTNLDTEQTRFAFGPTGSRVHAGFDFGVAGIWPELFSDVIRREPIVVLVCGHSKGGAEATIFAGRLVNAKTFAVQLVTFGSPRVGNRKFCRWLRSELVDCRRYVNGCDIVTRVPLFGVRLRPLGIQFCYRHVGPASYFDANGRLFVDPPRMYIVGDRLRARWRHLGIWGTAGVAAHDRSEYVAATRRAAA